MGLSSASLSTENKIWLKEVASAPSPEPINPSCYDRFPTMDDRGTGSTIARPAPPSRRRAPSSRNVSSSSRVESNPAVIVNKSEEEGQTTRMPARSSYEGLGLYSESSSDHLLSSSTEIPLEEVEKALYGLSREDLVLALKRAKEQMDIVSERLAPLTIKTG
jgi:hypothetical protein